MHFSRTIALTAISILFSSCSAQANLIDEASKWVRQSPVIAEDVGTISSVEQASEVVGSCAFTDGCRYQFTLQVEGENGIGTIRMLDAFTDRLLPNEFYVSSAIWHWQDEEVSIHGRSGMRYEEYYSLPNQLVLLDTEIAEGGGDQEDFYRRAIVNWLLGDRTQAYIDIQTSIRLEPTPEEVVQRMNPDLYEPFREARRTLATFQTLDGRYDDATSTVTQLLASYDEATPSLVRDYIFRWFVQTEAGKLSEANQVLAESCNLSSDSRVVKQNTEVEKAAKIIEMITDEEECGISVYKGRFYPTYLLYLQGELDLVKESLEENIDFKSENRRTQYDSDLVLYKGLLERVTGKLN